MSFIISLLDKYYIYFSLIYQDSFFSRLINVFSEFFSRLIDVVDKLLLNSSEESFTKKIFNWFVNNIKESYIFKKIKKICNKWFYFFEKKVNKFILAFNSSFFMNLTKSILNQFEKKTIYIIFIFISIVVLINLIFKFFLITSLFFRFLLILLSLALLFLFLERHGM
jgi:hypothetical protein